MKKLSVRDDSSGGLEIPKSRLVYILSGTIMKGDGHALAERRNGGDFANVAIYLTPKYDWELGVDAFGCNILVPIKK